MTERGSDPVSVISTLSVQGCQERETPPCRTGQLQLPGEGQVRKEQGVPTKVTSCSREVVTDWDD